MGACPLNALRGTETRPATGSGTIWTSGHALSTPFGALKHERDLHKPATEVVGHALSTPFGALKPASTAREPAQGPAGHALSTPFGALKPGTSAWSPQDRWGHALSTPFGALKLHQISSGILRYVGMPSQRPSGH